MVSLLAEIVRLREMGSVVYVFTIQGLSCRFTPYPLQGKVEYRSSEVLKQGDEPAKLNFCHPAVPMHAMPSELVGTRGNGGPISWVNGSSEHLVGSHVSVCTPPHEKDVCFTV